MKAVRLHSILRIMVIIKRKAKYLIIGANNVIKKKNIFLVDVDLNFSITVGKYILNLT